MVELSEHQAFEQEWWGTCLNTFGEEAKQITYATGMGLVNTPDPVTGQWPQYDLAGKSVLDIGGGPASLLLKTINGSKLSVLDPCPYPEWILDRYTAAGIEWYRYPAEEFKDHGHQYDEIWIYNVLQHVEDPAAVIQTARNHGKLLRIFDWIDTLPTLGHPNTLTKVLLDSWLGVDGRIFYVNENGAVGNAYMGAYPL